MTSATFSPVSSALSNLFAYYQPTLKAKERGKKISCSNQNGKPMVLKQNLNTNLYTANKFAKPSPALRIDLKNPSSFFLPDFLVLPFRSDLAQESGEPPVAICIRSPRCTDIYSFSGCQLEASDEGCLRRAFPCVPWLP